MQHTEPGELSYTELERRIKALPEGPANVFTTPRPFAIAGVIGNIGIILGLLPSLLATFMTPQMWMVWVAQFGLATAILGCAPEFFRSLWVVARGTYRWRLDQVTQLDHDLVQFRTLIAWLRRFPTAVLLEHLRFAHRVRTRLSMKIGLLSGGLDKLGVVPVLIALGIQVKALADWGADADLADPDRPLPFDFLPGSADGRVHAFAPATLRKRAGGGARGAHAAGAWTGNLIRSYPAGESHGSEEGSESREGACAPQVRALV
jgi:hypothetical protein